MKKSIVFIFVLVLLGSSVLTCHYYRQVNTIYVPKSDTITITKIDTQFVSKPQKVVERTLDTIWLKKSENEANFALKTQIEYKDSFYHAWISGIEPNLDSIYVYNKTKETTINNVKIREIKKNRLYLDFGGIYYRDSYGMSVGLSYVTKGNFKFGGEIGIIDSRPYYGVKIGVKIK